MSCPRLFSLLGRGERSSRYSPPRTGTWRIPNLLARSPGVVQLDRPSVPLGAAPASTKSRSPTSCTSRGAMDGPQLLAKFGLIQQKNSVGIPQLQALCILRDWSAVTGRTTRGGARQAAGSYSELPGLRMRKAGTSRKQGRKLVVTRKERSRPLVVCQFRQRVAMGRPFTDC